PPPVLDVGIESDVGPHRLVVRLDCFQSALAIDIVEPFYEILDRVGADLGDLLDPVFVAQHRNNLLVEDLPGELTGLHEDDAAVFRIGVIAEVRAFVDEALPMGIDHDAPRVGVLLEVVADRKVTELGRIAVPAYGVAAGPVSRRHRADIERHADAVTCVETCAADLCQFPAGPQIARAHLAVRLEAAGGQHHAFCLDVYGATVVLDPDAFDAVVIGDE